MLLELPYFEKIKEWKLYFYKNNLKKFFKEILIYDNLDNYRMNGGRFRKNNTFDFLLKNKKLFNNFSISFTLTNPRYFKNELFSILNKLKVLIENQFNIKLMISNDEFAYDLKNEFIKNNLNIKLIKSITSLDLNFNNYLSFFPLYDFLVPRNEYLSPENYKNFLKLNKDIQKKFIFLFSFECRNCPYYNEHYDLISNSDFEVPCFFKSKEDLFKKFNLDKNVNYTYEIANFDNYKILDIINLYKKRKIEIGGLKIGRNAFNEVLGDIDEILSAFKYIKRR